MHQQFIVHTPDGIRCKFISVFRPETVYCFHQSDRTDGNQILLFFFRTDIFFATWATRRMLCNTSSSFAPCSPFLICTDSLFPLPVSGEPKMFSHSTFSNSFLIFYVSRRHSVLFPFIFFFRCQFLYAPGQAFPLIRNVSFQYLILYKCKCFLLPPHCQHQ